MGIINCTPDSFSDGGQTLDVSAAVAAGIRMVDEGAAWLDVGGESSRPGAQAVTADEELQRTIPVIMALRTAGVRVPLSIDTTKEVVARAALTAGATAINDISAGSDPAMFTLAAESGCHLILMHRQGTAQNMQVSPHYGDVVTEVIAYLAERLSAARRAGVQDLQLFADPGFGFGKTVAHNYELLRSLPRIHAVLGAPLVVGISRKRFLSVSAGVAYPAADQVAHPLHAIIAPWCALLRVHDVVGTMSAVRAAGLA